MERLNPELAGQIMELAGTALEGLEYVHLQNSQVNLEPAMRVFVDVIEAFTEIEKALADGGFFGASGDALIEATESVRDGLDWLTKAYEKETTVGLLEIMEVTLLPRYKKWQEVLNERLTPYLPS